jgi:hypothetical protein
MPMTLCDPSDRHHLFWNVIPLVVWKKVESIHGLFHRGRVGVEWLKFWLREKVEGGWNLETSDLTICKIQVVSEAASFSEMAAFGKLRLFLSVSSPWPLAWTTFAPKYPSCCASSPGILVMGSVSPLFDHSKI